METSDNDDGYAADASANEDVASPSADEHPVADVEPSQPEPDVHFWRRAVDDPSTQRFGGALRTGMPGTIIVMSPADLSQVLEEERHRRRSSHQPASMRAFRSSQERIQLTTGAGSGTADGADEPTNEKSKAEGADGKPVSEPKDADEEIEHKPVDAGASPASDAEVVGKIKRRKSMYLTDDILKKESVEQYKIEIPLRKKVNKSTKKKLWREIERRKPFITENVREHIRTYAKPPFITWGCRNCVFPYESQA